MPHDLTVSEILALLANRRRRLLLRSMRDASRPLTRAELAHRIQNPEYDDSVADDLRAIQLSLFHSHLPKLEEADVVAYDENEETVSPDQNFERCIHLLENIDGAKLLCSDH